MFSLNAVAPIVLMAVIGNVLKRFKVIDDHFVEVATSFTFKICTPFLLFKQISNLKLEHSGGLFYIFYVVAALILLILVTMLVAPLFSKTRPTQGAIVHVMFRANFVTMGLALMVNLYGEEGLQALTLLFPVIIPLYNIFAILVLIFYSSVDKRKDKFSIKSIVTPLVKNPMIIGIFSGVIWMLIGKEIPIIPSRIIDSMSTMAIPLLLICLGAQFSFKKAGTNMKGVVIVSIIKLMIVPFIFLLPAYWLGFNKFELAAIFIVFTSPLSSASYIMANQMESNYDFTALAVMITTIMSPVVVLIGIPLLELWGIL